MTTIIIIYVTLKIQGVVRIQAEILAKLSNKVLNNLLIEAIFKNKALLKQSKFSKDTNILLKPNVAGQGQH